MPKNKTMIQRLIFVDRMIRAGMRAGTLANCRTMAAAYEVSSKSIMRDIDYLKNQCDAPLRYDQKRHGFFYTEEHYQLPAINISESDLFAIYIARKALAQHKNTPIYRKLVSVFNKIEQSLPDRVVISPAWVDNRISVFSDSQTNIAPQIWDTVAEGLHHYRQLAITYRNPDRKEGLNRLIDPYHAVSFQGEWYLVAFCQLRQAIRVFALSRIKQATLKKTIFTIPNDFELADYTDSQFGIFRSAQPCDVKIRFAPKHTPYVLERAWHKTQTITPQIDGGLILSFYTDHLFEVKRWILSWGSGVEVLEPDELRNDIRQETQKILQAYGE